MTPSEALGKPILDGRFRLDQVIGEGMSGRVVLATDLRAPASSQRCVVKTAASSIHAHAEIDAEREALRLLSSRHTPPSCIAPRHIADGIDQGIPFIVMEHIGAPYTSCDQLTAGTFLEGDVLQLWHALASLLEVAHDFGFLHNDIGPNKLNHLWWDTNPEPGTSHLARLKVIDWGNCVWPNRVGNQSSRTFKGELQATASAIFTITTGRPPADQRNLPFGWTKNDRKFLSGAFVALVEEVLADAPGTKIVSATALRERIEGVTTFREALARDQARVVTDARLREIETDCVSWTNRWGQLIRNRSLGNHEQLDALAELEMDHPLRPELVLPREYDKLVAKRRFEKRERLWLGLDGADQSGAVLLGTARLRILADAFNALPRTPRLPDQTEDWLQRVATDEGTQADELISLALLPPKRADLLLDNRNRASLEASGSVLASLIERAGMPRHGTLDRMIASSRRILRTAEPGFSVPPRPPVVPVGKDTRDSHAGMEWLVDLDVPALATLTDRVEGVRDWYAGTRTAIEDAGNRCVSLESHRKLIDLLKNLEKTLGSILERLKSDHNSPDVASAFKTWVKEDPASAPLARAASWAIAERPEPSPGPKLVSKALSLDSKALSAVKGTTNQGIQPPLGTSLPMGNRHARGGDPDDFETHARTLKDLVIRTITSKNLEDLVKHYAPTEAALLDQNRYPMVPASKQLEVLSNIIKLHMKWCEYSKGQLVFFLKDIKSHSHPHRKKQVVDQHIKAIDVHRNLIPQFSATLKRAETLLGGVKPLHLQDKDRVTHGSISKGLADCKTSLGNVKQLSTELKTLVDIVSNR